MSLLTDLTDFVDIPVRCSDPEFAVPEYARDGDAGLDLRALSGVVLKPGCRSLVDTGVSVSLPSGTAGFIQPRSGLAYKHGVTVLNTPGLIDCGYRDELKVLLVNLDPWVPYEVKRGDRIAQLVIQRVVSARLVPIDVLDDSERGSGGFGSTGV